MTGGRRRPRKRAAPLGSIALFSLLSVVCLMAFAGAALARPGGGQSYGGGSSGGGSGGGGGAGLIFFVVRIWIQFCIAYPQIGLPVTAVVVIGWLRYRHNHPHTSERWDTRTASPAPPSQPAAVDLDAIRSLDADFSSVLFTDFAYALYARAHEARSDAAALAALAPYLSTGARAHLAARRPPGAPVEGVVIGALRAADVMVPAVDQPGARFVAVTLEIESNMTVGSGAVAATQYVRERWRLVRDATAKSRPPEAVGSFHCPHCGAPFTDTGGGRCQYCGEVVTDGRFDWSVQTIEVESIEDRASSLAGTVAEQGTDLPTIFHPALAARRAELLQADPATTDAALAARLRLIYDRLNAAWTALDLTPSRPFVSDRLDEYLEYWIRAYKAQGLRNVLTGMRMTDAKLVKIVRDRWYDAVTFRLWATGRDSTVRQADGAVVAGDPASDRAYSEYWTLIRSARRQGPPRTDASCPNCGAPLAVNMAGNCEHCGALITRGDFDWVLSTIEQDDSYSG